MSARNELETRTSEYTYVRRMANFYSSWLYENFNEDFDIICDQMAVDKRGLLNRIDTHTLLQDHKLRGSDTLHFYLTNFRPTWTDCTCEGYYAENFGMSLWLRPKKDDDVDEFCAEKNCPIVSHVLCHEMLRRSGYRRHEQDVHEIWMKHYHGGFALKTYGKDHLETKEKPLFTTIDVNAVKALSR
ncbi:MAG: hypothetical protein K8823_462 [Cenarchaeum symbiont of Oopsacas minuta]|nr:hypothetical protein [Cenarchaeum symbiont of Oopsacas minuta]